MYFPAYRPRRLRKNENFRRMIRETRLTVDGLVLPLFITAGKEFKKPIASMPGHFQLSITYAVEEARAARDLGIPAVLLFGIPARKDETGTDAYSDDGVIQRAVREIKEAVPEILIVTDLCFCEYTDHGHCGILTEEGVDNDATLEIIAEAAVVQARAGSDIIAPSGMMDGAVGAIREALDEEGFDATPIMSYSAKYASCFYGPFRDAAESAPRSGDRKSYQMDPANSDEAMREITLDVEEGADIIMVKPALPYLDIIRRAREEFDLPLAAYNVSGEYAMIKAAANLGWIDGERAMLEALTSIKRAGADIIITYFAKDAAKLLAGR